MPKPMTKERWAMIQAKNKSIWTLNNKMRKEAGRPPILSKAETPPPIKWKKFDKDDKEIV